MAKHQLHIPRTGGTILRSVLASHGFSYHPHMHTIRDIPHGDTVMVCLRDPVERVISLYSYLFSMSKGVIPSIDDLIDDPVGFKEDIGYDRWGYLFNGQTWWIGDAEGVIILRHRYLFDDLKHRLGIVFEPDIAYASKIYPVTDAQKDALKTIYIEDYERLGHLF